MPFIVAHPVVSFLRRRVYTKKEGDRTAKKGNAIPPWNVHSITSSARASQRDCYLKSEQSPRLEIDSNLLNFLMSDTAYNRIDERWLRLDFDFFQDQKAAQCEELVLQAHLQPRNVRTAVHHPSEANFVTGCCPQIDCL